MDSLNKGYMSLDTLLAILPVLLIVVYTLNSVMLTKTNYENHFMEQNSFDRLVSSADYLVEYGLVVKDAEKYYPNWIDSLDQKVISEVRAKSGLKRFSVAFDEQPLDGDNCIYRIVAYGNEKQIKKIYFCGGM